MNNTDLFLFFFLCCAEGVADADLVLLVTTRPTTGNTLAWAVACERDQWGRAIAGNKNLGKFLTCCEQLFSHKSKLF